MTVTSRHKLGAYFIILQFWEAEVHNQPHGSTVRLWAGLRSPRRPEAGAGVPAFPAPAGCLRPGSEPLRPLESFGASSRSDSTAPLNLMVAPPC